VYCFDLVAADLEVEDFVGIDPALLDKSVAAYDDEELPLRVVPVLTLGDARLADVDADLTTVEGVDEFGEGTSVVYVHLQWGSDLLLWKITQVCAVEFLGEGVLRNLRNHEGSWLVGKAIDEVHDFSEGDFVGDRAIAVTTVLCRYGFHAVKLTPMSLALEGLNHLVHQVVDIEKLHLDASVIYLDREIVRDVVAECSYGTIVVRSAPFTEKVRETVHKYLSPRFLAIIEHQFLSGLLALAIFACAETACKGCLDRTGDHYRAVVAVFLESIKKYRGKAEVTFHEVLLVLRTVHSCQVEDEVAFAAVAVKVFCCGVDVVLEDFRDCEVSVALCLAGLYIVELGAEVTAYEPFGAGD